ncbi:MAG: SAM-dependent methyltransferase [Lachnospiraceae bacterium]|nr:SAM-dependent methyltransferase [Lachnospiraceae bacterium]
MGRKVELSKRMQAVADMVTPGNRVCDVGCDHGYVSIYLVQEGIAPKVLAMDVNKGPLMRAGEHVKRYEAEDYIELRLSDGLTAYRIGEADTLLCAGMGGRLMMDILDREPDKTKDFGELILQPQSDVKLFRKYLREKGYIIQKETMILEEGKYYPMMKVVLSGKVADETKDYELEDLLGPLLLKELNPVLLQYIQQEMKVKEGIIMSLTESQNEGKVQQRKQELKKELALLKRAAKMYD